VRGAEVLQESIGAEWATHGKRESDLIPEKKKKNRPLVGRLRFRTGEPGEEGRKSYPGQGMGQNGYGNRDKLSLVARRYWDSRYNSRTKTTQETLGEGRGVQTTTSLSTQHKKGGEYEETIYTLSAPLLEYTETLPMCAEN